MKFFLAALTVVAALEETGDTNDHWSPMMHKSMILKRENRFLCEEIEHKCPVQVASSGLVPCVGGKAGEYECSNTDQLSFVSLADLGCQRANDIWGWTDPNGAEIALFKCTRSTVFVDVTNPSNPEVLASIRATNNVDSIWGDIKVYKDRAYIVTEGAGHGIQIFDLLRLRNIPRDGTGPVDLEPDHLYNANGHGSSHNIVINEDTGFGYSVGTRTCRGGLHMLKLDLLIPEYVGCFDADGYTHDAECVTYDGPDGNFRGAEICFNYNEDTLTIVDVSDHSNPVQLSRMGYPNSAYTHQGWVNEAQTHLLLDDELDEVANNGSPDTNTVTYIWDIQDLTAPTLIGNYTAAVKSIDHNLYNVKNHAYMANYESGLRILDISRIAEADLKEVGYFDVRPEDNNGVVEFNGAWSVYPFFDSGSIVVSSIERGLFVLKFNDPDKKGLNSTVA